MLFFSIFLAGFTLGIFAALKIFAPENREESWDPQNLPVKASYRKIQHGFAAKLMKNSLIDKKLTINSKAAVV